MKTFDPQLEIKAGQALDYRCDYNNTQAIEVNQGPRSKDEMCMLLGVYYPRDEALERCVDETTGFLAGTWFGDGTADGAASLMCMATAKTDGEFFGCVTDSCPAVGPQVTEFIRCRNTAGYGKCQTQCSPPSDQATCLMCITTECEATQTAVANAKCQ